MPTYLADVAGVQISPDADPSIAREWWVYDRTIGDVPTSYYVPIAGNMGTEPPDNLSASHACFQFGPFTNRFWLTSATIRLTFSQIFGNYDSKGIFKFDVYTQPQGVQLPRVNGIPAAGTLNPQLQGGGMSADNNTGWAPTPINWLQCYSAGVPPPTGGSGSSNWLGAGGFNPSKMDFTFDATGLSAINSVITGPDWDGYIIFSMSMHERSVYDDIFYVPPPIWIGIRPGTYVDISTSPDGSGNSPRLITEETSYDSAAAIQGDSGPETGRPWKDGGHDGVSRLDRCPRCGNLSLRSRWVRDGLTQGQRVCLDCFDPTDPDDIDRPNPPERTPLRNEDD